MRLKLHGGVSDASYQVRRIWIELDTAKRCQCTHRIERENWYNSGISAICGQMTFVARVATVMANMHIIMWR